MIDRETRTEQLEHLVDEIRAAEHREEIAAQAERLGLVPRGSALLAAVEVEDLRELHRQLSGRPAEGWE